MRAVLLRAAVLVGAALLWEPATSALPEADEAVQVGDVPATDGAWQQGWTVVPASPAAVRDWLLDAPRWPERFPDVKSVEDLGRAPDGATVVRFHSSILERPATIRIHPTSWGFWYEGGGKGFTTQGRTYLTPVAGGTRVLMQTTSEVHGFLSMIVSDEARRERSIHKLRSDLTALQRLAGNAPPQ